MAETLERGPAVTRAIEHAAEQARQLGHRRIGSEHLLLTLLAEPEGPVADVLAALHLQWETVLAEIKQIMPGSARPTEGALPMTESASAAVQRAEAVARRLRAPMVELDHLLLGIAAQQEGVASRVLLTFGATPEKIRRLVEQETTERQTHTCQNCGAELQLVWRFCPMCGTRRVGH